MAAAYFHMEVYGFTNRHFHFHINVANSTESETFVRSIAKICFIHTFKHKPVIIKQHIFGCV